MALCKTTVGTPVGLQKLSSAERVAVRQKTSMFANKYELTTADGELIFNAKEDSSAIDVMLGGKRRSFHIDLYDVNDEKVITLRRPYSLGASKLQVCVCGAAAGVVRQQATLLKPVLSINDARDRPVFRVKGPLSYHSECDFDVLTLDKKQRIGRISKKWGALRPGRRADADSFHVEFPPDLDVAYKAAILGTCLLIDFLYYEKDS